MNRFFVSRVLLVVLLIIALSACAPFDTQPLADLRSEVGELARSVIAGEEVLESAVEEAAEETAAEAAEAITAVEEEVDEALDALATAPLAIAADTYSTLYQEVNPSVVNIRVTAELTAVSPEQPTPQLPDMPQLPGFPHFQWPEMPEMAPMPFQGQGSGFVYDANGHIVTNHHVVAHAADINVIFADGTEVDAELVGADPDTDLAVLKVDPDTLSGGLPRPLALGDSSALQIGQHVIAIGNPFGLSGSMTTGIISGLGRVLPAGASHFSIPDIIQTDAAINPGNSGGPLLNLHGEVIGVNTAITSPNRAFAGIGYAVPVAIVRQVVPELIAEGRVQHPWLGIAGRTLDRETAVAMDLDPGQRGVLIAEVVAGGPAHEAGLRGSDVQVEVDGGLLRIGGDIVVGVDDHAVEDFDDLLSFMLNGAEVGQTVTLHILRDGEPLTVDVTLGARPASAE